MFVRTITLALGAAVGGVDIVGVPSMQAQAGRAPVAADSTPRGRDSTGRPPATLAPVTVATAPVERTEPLSVVRITAATIAQTPANSPWELLRETAGVEAHEQGQGPGFASDMSVRGFSSDHSTDLALWIDGVPINEPVNGHAEGYNDFSLLFPQAVSSMDVIKGPTSALYGNFAFSGVVNVRTLERFEGTQLEATGGSYGNAESALLTGFDRGPIGGVLGVRVAREDGFRPHAVNQLGQLHGRLVDQITPSTTIDAGVELYATSYVSPGFLDTASYLANRYHVVSNFGDGGFKRRAQERVSLRTVLAPTVFWRTTVYSTQSTWKFWLSTPPGLGGLLEGTGVETREYDGRVGVGATSALTYTAGHVEITAGGEARYTRAHYENWAQAQSGFRVDSAPNLLVPNSHQTSGGLFVQSAFDFDRVARLTVGGRVDQLTTTAGLDTSTTSPREIPPAQIAMRHSHGVFSPKVGLLVRPVPTTPWIGLYANASRGFRQGDGVISDPTVPFIYVWNYETGVKLDPGPVTADISLFRMDVSNEQTVNPVTVTAFNGGKSRRQGLDVDAHATVAPGLTISSAFTVLHAVYTTAATGDTPPANLNGRQVYNTSKYVGVATAEWAPPHEPWHLRVGTNVVGPYAPFDEPGVLRPGYGLVHASGGVQLRSVGIDIGMRNILDTRYRELEAGGFVTPGEPRALFATVRYVMP